MVTHKLHSDSSVQGYKLQASYVGLLNYFYLWLLHRLRNVDYLFIDL